MSTLLLATPLCLLLTPQPQNQQAPLATVEFLFTLARYQPLPKNHARASSTLAAAGLEPAIFGARPLNRTIWFIAAIFAQPDLHGGLV